jgi:hypothetical protein
MRLLEGIRVLDLTNVLAALAHRPAAAWAEVLNAAEADT